MPAGRGFKSVRVSEPPTVELGKPVVCRQETEAASLSQGEADIAAGDVHDEGRHRILG